MKTLCFAFDDLDLVIAPFDSASVNGVVAVVENAVSIPFKGFCKAVTDG